MTSPRLVTSSRPSKEIEKTKDDYDDYEGEEFEKDDVVNMIEPLRPQNV